MSEKAGEIYYEVGIELEPLLQGAKQANAAIESMGKGADSAASGVSSLERATQKTSKAIVRAAEDSSNAAKLIERLGNEIAIMEEASQSGAKSAAVLAAQIAASGDASESQIKEVGQLTAKLYDLKSAQASASREAAQSAKQEASQAGEAAKLRSMASGLTKQIAVLNEEQKNGARSAAMLSARLQAGSSATAAQRKEIGELAGKLFDLKLAQEQVNSAQQKSSGIMGGLKTGLSAIASTIAISQLVQYARQFLEIADAMTQLQARVARLSTDSQEAARTFGALANLASATGSSLKDTTKLWETLTSSLKDAGATNAQVLNLTSTLQKIGKIGGSSPEEMANALRQFGQSIASGTIRAEEFNSILEQMPELARQIADGMGISGQQLKRVMLDGKLTAQDALNAIQDQTGKVDEEFKKLPRSMGQATNSLSISFDKLIDQINKTAGFSQGAVDAIDELARSIDTLGTSSSSALDRLAALGSVMGWISPVAAEAAASFDKMNKSKVDNLNSKILNLKNDLKAVTKAGDEASEATKHITIKKPEDDKSKKGNSSKSVDDATQALARQEAQLARLNTGYAEGSLELAKYDAVQALGNKATAQQIADAKAKAASIWEVQRAVKAAADEEQKRQQASKNFTGLQSQASPVFAVDNQYAIMRQQLVEYAAFNKDKVTEIESVRASIEEQYRQQRMAAQWQELSQMGLGYNMLTSAVDTFGGNASNVLTGLMTGTMSASDAMRSLGNTVLNSVVNSIVQVGVEMLKNFILAQTVGVASQAANTAAATAGGAAALAAWAPAAIAASIATAGAASGTGLAAYSGAQASGAALSVLGARKQGGPVSANQMYRIGEGGMPEIYQASNGSQYMIPGDNGKVISNKDMQGGGVNVVINVTNNTSAQTQFTPSYDQQSNTLTIDGFIADMREKGPMHRSITQNTSATTRL